MKCCGSSLAAILFSAVAIVPFLGGVILLISVIDSMLVASIDVCSDAPLLVFTPCEYCESLCESPIKLIRFRVKPRLNVPNHATPFNGSGSLSRVIGLRVQND